MASTFFQNDVEDQLRSLDPRLDRLIATMYEDFQNQLRHLEDSFVSKDDFQSLRNDLNHLQNNFVPPRGETHQEYSHESGIVPFELESYNTKSKIFGKILNGVGKDVGSKGQLEQDLFTMMMLSNCFSLTWLAGLTSFGIQVTLGIILILDQIDSPFFGTLMKIPIRAGTEIRIAQVLALILSAMTQTDLLFGLRNLLLLPHRKKDRWGKLIDVKGDINFLVWVRHILIPNFLKMGQGALILAATFLLIVQSDSIVELLKDFSALFVISAVDELFYMLAVEGFFGVNLLKEAEKAKQIIIDKNEKSLKLALPLSLVTITCPLLLIWVAIVVAQEQGVFVKQKYPLCPVDTKFNGTTYLSIIGDDTCQFERGKGANILNCGWDGGDCMILNERYPNCVVNEPGRLGDGICDGSEYNIEECGFDNGDCIKLNDELKELYPNCTVKKIQLLGNGFCDGGDYFTEECGLDRGDCAKCNVEDPSLTGDGFCNGGDYFTEECGLDGGDCANCNVEDPSLIGDGFCDEGRYNTHECSFDGGDCAPSIDLVGEVFDGLSKWEGTVLGSDGFVYGIPYGNIQVLKFDPQTNTSKLVGGNLVSASSQWSGGVLGKDGFIYGIPLGANAILKYDPKTENSTRIERGHELLISDNKFSGGVVVDSGDIYFVPHAANKVVRFIPSNSSLLEIGKLLGDGRFKMSGGVKGRDGNIYCIPYKGNKVLKINVLEQTVEDIGDEYPGEDFKWSNGWLADNGNIYASPLDRSQILEIDVKSQTTQLVGPNLGNDTWKWSGFVQGTDKHLYGIPYSSNKLLRFDPNEKTATMIPLDEKISNAANSGEYKWYSGVRASNGFIYSAPSDGNRVLAIAPIRQRRDNDTLDTL